MDITRDCKDYKNALLPDEQVVWSGTPGNVPLMTEETRKLLPLRWIVCGIAFIVLTVAYAILLGKNGSQFNFLVELLLLVACAYIAYIPILDWNDLRRKTSYYITNKRIVLVVGKSVYALNRAGIKMDCQETADGAMHIIWGAGAGIPVRRYRRLTVIPDSNDENPCLIFYHVKENIPELEALLSA